MTDLRFYQAEVVAKLDRAGPGRHLLVAPTGSGKTVIAAEVIRRTVARGSAVLFLAHRRELVAQACAKLHAVGIDSGIIQAGFEGRPHVPVQVASVQTLWARAYRGTRMEPPPADLVVVDEAHHVRARTYERIIASYPEARVLGLTATPCRADGRGLGNAFKELVQCPDIDDLIADGYLVPTKVYAPSTPDLTGIRVDRGDYVEAQLAERVNTDQLVGDIVEHWHRLADRRKTVAFATDVAHSVHIRDEFRRAEVLAEHIDGTTPTDERDAILKKLSHGEIDVVTNCMVLTEGWDQPDVSCIVLARPTKSLGLYRQMVGRVLRPAPGKVEALVLDHAGLTLAHGFVEEPVPWSLAEDRRSVSLAQAARADGVAAALTTCPECSAVRRQGQPCPACGWRPRPKAVPLEVIDGELAHISRDGRVAAQNGHDHRRFMAQLIFIGRERGYAAGWAAHKFKEKFGAFPPWPRWRNPEPEPPEPAVRSWVRSRQIAYARAQSR